MERGPKRAGREARRHRAQGRHRKIIGRREASAQAGGARGLSGATDRSAVPNGRLLNCPEPEESGIQRQQVAAHRLAGTRWTTGSQSDLSSWSEWENAGRTTAAGNSARASATNESTTAPRVVGAISKAPRRSHAQWRNRFPGMPSCSQACPSGIFEASIGAVILSCKRVVAAFRAHAAGSRSARYGRSCLPLRASTLRPGRRLAWLAFQAAATAPTPAATACAAGSPTDSAARSTSTG